ncbi:MAG: hypothetical protein KDA81_05125 [Planctomycetaceae bacterium]|nr:hypothetical protein [Planctomycetaceae bacterium]
MQAGFPPSSEAPGEFPHASDLQYINRIVKATVSTGFEMYNPHSEKALVELKQMGFTQVILDWPNLHQAAADCGLKFVLAHWWNDKTTEEEILSAVERARSVDRGSLIGFSVMDEPERNSPDTPFGFYVDLYEKLKPIFAQEFSGTRLEISHWGPLARWTDEHYEYFSYLYEAADVMRIMPYPDLHEAPLCEVFLMMQRTQRLMKLADRRIPLVVILQTWVLPPENKLPEIAELRVMLWQAMLCGAETVSFFDYNQDVWSQTPGFAEQFRELMQEATSFQRRFGGMTAESTMSRDGVLSARVKSSDGKFHQILVNTRRTAVGSLDPLAVLISEIRGSEESVAACDVPSCRQTCDVCHSWNSASGMSVICHQNHGLATTWCRDRAETVFSACSSRPRSDRRCRLRRRLRR